MESTPNEQIPQIEAILRKGAWAAKNDDEFCLMAQAIIDKSPQNPKDLHSALRKYLVNGDNFNKGTKKAFSAVLKQLTDGGFIGAKKKVESPKELDTPSTMYEDSESQQDSAIMQKESPDEECKREAMYGADEGDESKNGWLDKKEKQFAQRKYDEQAAIEHQIDNMLATKEKINPPEVMHDKSELHQADIFLPGVTIIAGSQLLIEDATVKFTKGRKYGLVGRNGTGKTTLINAICRKELDKMPQNVHILQVEQEVPGDNMSILDHVLACDVERTKLMKESDDIPNIDRTNMPEEDSMALDERLSDVIEQLDMIDAKEAPSKATLILIGLGFTEAQLHWASKKFSGGWRMRISIAKVVFCEPEILMLDEPTNHLDLEALIWLEQYIQNLQETTVVIISHARDFLNATVDEIIELQNKQLIYYKGNFDSFQKVKKEQIAQRIKKREFQLAEIAHNQDFVDRFRANAKRSTLAQSRQKVINKIKLEMEEEIFEEPSYVFQFPVPPKLNRPILRITDGKVGYSKEDPVMTKVNLEIDMETRIAFVGPNGAGKSTLLKTLIGKLDILDGNRIINGKVKIGVFTQHHMDMLVPRLSALEFFHQKWPLERAEALRGHLGAFGISNELALKPMALLSGGQKSRISFALITFEQPQILMLDEPTNHLDYDAINALIESLKGYKGGLCVISHDQYFLNALCDRISIVENGEVYPYSGSIEGYIKELRKKHGADFQ